MNKINYRAKIKTSPVQGVPRQEQSANKNEQSLLRTNKWQ